MSQTHIRIARTPEVNKVLSLLRQKYTLLSEAEIIKIALSEQYRREQNQDEKKLQRAKEAWERLKVEGKKIGDKLLATKGLKREDVTEQEFYNLFLDDHKDKD